MTEMQTDGDVLAGTQEDLDHLDLTLNIRCILCMFYIYSFTRRSLICDVVMELLFYNAWSVKINNEHKEIPQFLRNSTIPSTPKYINKVIVRFYRDKVSLNDIVLSM